MTATAAKPISAAQLTIVPANQASWADLQAIFGVADYPGRCYCQHFKTEVWPWSLSDDERRRRLREQTNCDDPSAESTTGLVAYLGAEREPVGWVARGVSDDPLAWQGDHLGRAARRKPSGLRRSRLHRSAPPQPAPRGDARRLPGERRLHDQCG